MVAPLSTEEAVFSQLQFTLTGSEFEGEKELSTSLCFHWSYYEVEASQRTLCPLLYKILPCLSIESGSRTWLNMSRSVRKAEINQFPQESISIWRPLISFLQKISRRRGKRSRTKLGDPEKNGREPNLSPWICKTLLEILVQIFDSCFCSQGSCDNESEKTGSQKMFSP